MVVAINTVPVVAGGISSSNIVALFSAEELATSTELSGGTKNRHHFHCKWVARCFQKGAARTVTTTRTCY